MSGSQAPPYFGNSSSSYDSAPSRQQQQQQQQQLYNDRLRSPAHRSKSPVPPDRRVLVGGSQRRLLEVATPSSASLESPRRATVAGYSNSNSNSRSPKIMSRSSPVLMADGIATRPSSSNAAAAAAAVSPPSNSTSPIMRGRALSPMRGRSSASASAAFSPVRSRNSSTDSSDRQYRQPLPPNNNNHHTRSRSPTPQMLQQPSLSYEGNHTNSSSSHRLHRSPGPPPTRSPMKSPMKAASSYDGGGSRRRMEVATPTSRRQIGGPPLEGGGGSGSNSASSERRLRSTPDSNSSGSSERRFLPDISNSNGGSGGSERRLLRRNHSGEQRRLLRRNDSGEQRRMLRRNDSGEQRRLFRSTHSESGTNYSGGGGSERRLRTTPDSTSGGSERRLRTTTDSNISNSNSSERRLRYTSDSSERMRMYDSARSMNSSQSGRLDYSTVVPPAETTRPTPIKTDFRAIMNEQAEQRQREKQKQEEILYRQRQQQQQQQEEEETLRLVEMAQEEEVMRLAMEMSLNESKKFNMDDAAYDNSEHQQSFDGGTANNSNNNNNNTGNFSHAGKSLQAVRERSCEDLLEDMLEDDIHYMNAVGTTKKRNNSSDRLKQQEFSKRNNNNDDDDNNNDKDNDNIQALDVSQQAVLDIARRLLPDSEVKLIQQAFFTANVEKKIADTLHPNKDNDEDHNTPPSPSKNSRQSSSGFISAFESAAAVVVSDQSRKNNTNNGGDDRQQKPQQLSVPDRQNLENVAMQLSPHDLRALEQVLRTNRGNPFHREDYANDDDKMPATVCNNKKPTISYSSAVAAGGSNTTTSTTNQSAASRRHNNDTITIASQYDFSGAEQHLSEEELLAIQQALAEEDIRGHDNHSSTAAAAAATTTAAVASLPPQNNNDAAISAEESAAIMAAIREADEAEERRSLELAMQMHHQEQLMLTASNSSNMRSSGRFSQGNVRTMTRAEIEAEKQSGAFNATFDPPRHPLEREYDQSKGGDDDDNYYYQHQHRAAGFRMNANNPNQDWARGRDQHSVIGPNNEIRTKHDETIDGMANLHRLGLESYDNDFPLIGNKAYNAFKQSVKSSKKGVSTKGTGRAGSDADGTKGGAMDPRVRAQITKAINNELIEHCNGVVKEGKEAILYHADKGKESQGFDVAIKVFKRIQEFRGRGEYVDGDPRYGRSQFRNASNREQIEVWAEKEYRNLIRANRTGVPVPTPLHFKENILFMRFLGTDGWPAPQLREVELRRGSSRWGTLFWQIMEAVRNLYQRSRLVHGDLSEYNVMVVPAHLVENKATGVDAVNDDLQAVLIDFGQAVDTRHPETIPLLERDLDRIVKFFMRQGIAIMSKEEAKSYVLEPMKDDEKEMNSCDMDDPNEEIKSEVY